MDPVIDFYISERIVRLRNNNWGSQWSWNLAWEEPEVVHVVLWPVHAFDLRFDMNIGSPYEDGSTILRGSACALGIQTLLEFDDIKQLLLVTVLYAPPERPELAPHIALQAFGPYQVYTEPVKPSFWARLGED